MKIRMTVNVLVDVGDEKSDGAVSLATDLLQRGFNKKGIEIVSIGREHAEDVVEDETGDKNALMKLKFEDEVRQLIEQLNSLKSDFKPMPDSEIQESPSQHPEEYLQCKVCGRWSDCNPCDICYDDPLVLLHLDMEEE